MAGTSFHFIVSDGPEVPKDPGVRTLIRKQAMKDVGIARKRNRKGRGSPQEMTRKENNVPECPGNAAFDPDEVDEIILRDLPKDNQLQKRIDSPMECESALVTPSLHPAYQRTRMKFSVDLTDLTILTNFNINNSAMPVLTSNPSQLAALLGHKAWSFLDFVPSRYGFSECLTTATDCLLAKAHAVLTTQSTATSRANCNQLYGRALRALQDALTDDRSCLGPDVLCATQLLSLHEVFELPSNVRSRSFHC